MNFEKLMNSKINVFADWVIRLIMINLMIIVSSLLLLTIYPALCAGYNMLHDYVNGKNPKLFKGFYGYFKEAFMKKVVVGIIIGISVLIGFLNVRYYSTVLEIQTSTFYFVGYYVTLALLAALYAGSFYSIVVFRVSPSAKVRNIIKVSFILAGKFYFRTLLLVVVNTGVVFLLVYPPTAMIFIFMGVSIVLAVDVLVTTDVVYYLANLGEKDD